VQAYRFCGYVGVGVGSGGAQRAQAAAGAGLGPALFLVAAVSRSPSPGRGCAPDAVASCRAAARLGSAITGCFPQAHHDPGRSVPGLGGSAHLVHLRHSVHRSGALYSRKTTAPLRCAPYMSAITAGIVADESGKLSAAGQSVAGLWGHAHGSMPAIPCPGELWVAGDLCMSAAHRAGFCCMAFGSGPECGRLWGPGSRAILWGPQVEQQSLKCITG